MDKEFIRQYKQDMEALKLAQENIRDLNLRKEALKKEIVDLNTKLTQADSLKQKALQQLALGENSQSEVDKAKKSVLQLKESIEDTQAMLSAVNQKIKDLDEQINTPFGLKQKTEENKRAIYREIYTELAEDLRRTSGKQLIKCYSAYRESGGLLIMKNGFFLNELLDKLEPTMEQQNIFLQELDAEYGL